MALAARIRAWVPRWWRGEGGTIGLVLDLVLLPAELLMRTGVRVRGLLYRTGSLRSHRAPIPVISIGNLSVGGTGKTPIAAYLASRLEGWGHRPGIVLRGYGRDEVAVHTELNPGVPVHIAPRRLEGVRAAYEAGNDCALIDDGFQHRALHRDLDLVLIAAESWGARRRALPRGPWREAIGALRRADFLLVTRKTAPVERARAIAEELVAGGYVARAGVARLSSTRLLRLDGKGSRPLASLAGVPVLALSTLAEPGPVLELLERAGAGCELIDFPDHHEFTPADLQRIEVWREGREVVVTRKEAVKLRGRIRGEEVWVLDQEVEIEHGGAELDAALQQALSGS